MAKRAALGRSTEGLRNALFDEIDELRSGKGDPLKSRAVADLSRQIMSIARTEIEVARLAAAHDAAGSPLQTGSIQLGAVRPKALTSAASAKKRATGR